MVEVNSSLYLKKKSKLNTVLNVIIGIILIAIVIEILFSTTYAGIYIVDRSMNDTLIGAEADNKPGGDYVYVNLRARPDYKDIVVVNKGNGEFIIKRVVAFGGDCVKIVRGQLYVKYAGTSVFERIDEPYVSEENNSPAANNFAIENGYTVEENCLFLLGDNRNYSVDSRDRGGISYPMSSLYGVVTKWSLTHKKFLTDLHNYFYFTLPKCFGLK